MKKPNTWSYAPYRPFFYEVGDIYICRVVPREHGIRFEWLRDTAESDCNVYFRVRGEGDFKLAGSTKEDLFDIEGLELDKDYEFYVACGEKKSRVRLAHTGAVIGKIVNYLHPDDEAYSFSGRYLCSPSLVRHPDGYLLASMDVFAGGYPQSLTLIFRSDDNGESWHYVSELFPCFWGKLFVYGKDIYMLSCSSEYSDLLIGKSTDGAKSFCEPTMLLRGGNGKNGEAGVHKNPQPVVSFGGRIWNTLEWGSWGRGYHAAMVMSAPEGSDLLDASNWSFSEPVKYDKNWVGVPAGESSGNIEGCLVPIDGELYNIMRYDMTKMKPCYGKVVMYRVDTSDPEAPLEYVRCIDFPANHSKFEMKYDEVSGKYYSLATRIIDEAHAHSRTLLSLMVSDNGVDWRLKEDIIDRLMDDPGKVGFQYVDFIFDGDDIIFLCRTGMNGSRNHHDTNYSTFHRIKNFRGTKLERQ